MASVATGPDWASVITAIGTVAVAVVAVGVAFFAEWRAGLRLREEQARHDTEIADERALADKRLTQQLAHSDAQLADERAHSAEQLREERQLAKEREQLAEAYAIQVVLMRTAREAPDASRLLALLVNRSRQTVTQIEAQFSPDGQSLIPHHRQLRVPSYANLPPGMPDDPQYVQPAKAASSSDRLTPWDAGMTIETDLIDLHTLTDPHVIVRWTDRWGTRWEHKRGDVRPVQPGAQWSAQ